MSKAENWDIVKDTNNIAGSPPDVQITPQGILDLNITQDMIDKSAGKPTSAVYTKGSKQKAQEDRKAGLALLESQSDRCKDIIHLRYQGKGFRNIAAITNTPESQVRLVCSSKLASNYMMELSKQDAELDGLVNMAMKSTALDAVDVLAELLNDPSLAAKDRIAAANSLLSKSGFGEVKKKEVKKTINQTQTILQVALDRRDAAIRNVPMKSIEQEEEENLRGKIEIGKQTDSNES